MTSQAEAQQRWRDRNPGYAREIAYRRKYGLTVAGYEALLEKQHGKCAICGKVPDVLAKHTQNRLQIDHSHVTGAVRGLLCPDCNRGLGSFRDDRDAMSRAIAYLEEAACPSST